MRIVVSDTSCMIDLRKGGLLEAMLQLPYSMESQGSVPVEVLHNALQLFLEDELVFLPSHETRQRIRRLSRRL